MLRKYRNSRVFILAMIAALMLSVCPVFAEDSAPEDPVEVVKAEQIIEVAEAKEIVIGNTAKLNAVLKEGDGKLTYASSNKKVATVTSSGIVKAKAVGTAMITVKAAETEKYAAKECDVVITVIPKVIPVKSLVCNKKGQFTVKWTPNKKADGYEVEYVAGTKKFKEAKVKKVKKATTGKAVVKKLKKQRYYVRIRTYKVVDGVKYYSKWSKVKSIRVR